ncbi:MAG: 50S ribosomal protein L23 [Legionella sp.]|nr:50S ribosomal protein L23 [Legionella sp.]
MKTERLLTVLLGPHVSEKSTVMSDKFRQYTFKVLRTATKLEIKSAVEQLFKVKVRDVSVMNVKGKKKRFKQSTGVRKDWKKAFVSLQHDSSDIDFTVNE